MAAAFTKVNSETATYSGTLTTDTAFTYTPEVGDIVAYYLQSTTEGHPRVSCGGATFSLIDWAQVDDSGDMFTVKRCTAGGTSDNITIDQDFDSFSGHAIVIVRPVDLTYAGIANTSGEIDTVNASGSLTVGLTTSSPAGLLAFGGIPANQGWTDDSGWTGLSEDRDSAFSLDTQYRLSDDTEWVANPDPATIDIAGLVLEFSAAAADDPPMAHRRRHHYGGY